MSVVMRGTDVAKSMKETLVQEVEALGKIGITPCLSIIRVGARPDDLSYERSARKRMETTGIVCRVTELPEDVSQEEFERTFSQINEDKGVHGILLLRPLPESLDEEPVRAMIDPKKDVDGMSPVNMAKIFSGDSTGFGHGNAPLLRNYAQGETGDGSGAKHGSGTPVVHAFAQRAWDGYAMPYPDREFAGGMFRCRDSDCGGRESKDGVGRYGGRRRSCG